MRAALRWLVAATLLVAGCDRCGGAASTSATTGPPASIAPDAGSSARRFPEVHDTGRGRATAALRSALGGYGIAFDEEALARACKVGPEGVSIDDLEEAGRALGLDDDQTIVPVENVLAGDAPLLPAIVVLEASANRRDFVLLSRVEGDAVEVMHPREGAGMKPRLEIERRLHVHEMQVSAAAFRDTARSTAFTTAIRARIRALPLDDAKATAWLDQAARTPGYRGFAALDAGLRRAEHDGLRAAGGSPEALIDGALDPSKNPLDPPKEDQWSVRPHEDPADADAEVTMRGTVLLAIEGRAAVK